MKPVTDFGNLTHTRARETRRRALAIAGDKERSRVDRYVEALHLLKEAREDFELAGDQVAVFRCQALECRWNAARIKERAESRLERAQLHRNAAEFLNRASEICVNPRLSKILADEARASLSTSLILDAVELMHDLKFDEASVKYLQAKQLRELSRNREGVLYIDACLLELQANRALKEIDDKILQLDENELKSSYRSLGEKFRRAGQAYRVVSARPEESYCLGMEALVAMLETPSVETLTVWEARKGSLPPLFFNPSKRNRAVTRKTFLVAGQHLIPLLRESQREIVIDEIRRSLQDELEPELRQEFQKLESLYPLAGKDAAGRDRKLGLGELFGEFQRWLKVEVPPFLKQANRYVYVELKHRGAVDPKRFEETIELLTRPLADHRFQSAIDIYLQHIRMGLNKSRRAVTISIRYC